MNLSDLSTPAAVVDLDVVERNAARMAERARRLGVRLRPHVKTHKCVEAALLELGGRPGPITVSTLAEARHFAAAGFADITYAVPVALQRLEEAAELAGRLERLSLVVDHPDTVRALELCAAARSVRLSVFLKVDCGAHRAGVDPTGDEAVALAQLLSSSPHLEFRGLLTHAGQAYRCRDLAAVRQVAADERDALLLLASRLRQQRLEVTELSLGSTPTVSVGEDLTGITEVRPGNYVFCDLTQVALGVCSLADVGFCVLATVIGSYPGRGALVVDAGALALSKDPGPVHVDPQCGFGLAVPADGRTPAAPLRVESLTQEHGLLRVAAPLDLSAYPIGSCLRILPNHSCLAAACFDRYHLVRGDELVGEWRPCRGW